MSPIADTRTFLAALTGGRPASSGIPQYLYRLAARVLRRSDLHAVQDLVGDLLLDLLERDGQAGSVAELLRLDDRGLAGALSRRALQIAFETNPRHGLTKSLREHVAVALAGDLPDVDAPPTSLTINGRIQAHLVGEGLSYLLAQPEAPTRSVKVLAAMLMETYFPKARQLDQFGADAGSAVDAGSEEQVQRALDGPVIVADLQDTLGPELSCVLGCRAKGATLGSIADDLGVAISTAHQRLATATSRVRAWAKTSRTSRSCLEGALVQLG